MKAPKEFRSRIAWRRKARTRSAAKRCGSRWELRTRFEVVLLGAAKPGLLLLGFCKTKRWPCSGLGSVWKWKGELGDGAFEANFARLIAEAPPVLLIQEKRQSLASVANGFELVPS